MVSLDKTWVVIIPAPGKVWKHSSMDPASPFPFFHNTRRAAICRYAGSLLRVNLELGIVSFIGVFDTSTEARIFQDLYNAF
ncbi:hypothetical protein LCGC14_0232420 [marine sediment metagenome]|uniref:Uncharacterized protein n=1 Tax=marine sediment metagenome TaxID=412755 RepID=A0A0F9WUT5_9ZZZZ